MRRQLTPRNLLRTGILFLVLVGMFLLGMLSLPLIAQKPSTSSVAAAPNPSPIFNGTTIGSYAVLDHGWRVGVLPDSVDGAAADFDDSNWAVRDGARSFAEVDEGEPGEQHKLPLVPGVGPVPGRSHHGPPDNPGNSQGNHGREAVERAARSSVWLRLHVQLAPNHGPMALLVELPVSRSSSFDIGNTTTGAMDVFADGKRIMPDGPHGDAPEKYEKTSRLYHLNVPQGETSLVIAIRIPFISFGRGSYTEFFSNHTLLLGASDSLLHPLKLWVNRVLFERLPQLVSGALYLVLACFLLALYATQRDHKEYLWLGLYYLAQAPCNFIELAGSMARMERVWAISILLQLLIIASYFYFEFLVVFLALRRRWYIRLLRWTSPVLLTVGPLLLIGARGPGMLMGLAGLVFVLVGLVCLVWFGIWLLFVLLTLTIAAVRRNFEAALLLVPFLFGLVGIIEPALTEISREISGSDVQAPLTIHAGPIPIHFDAIANFTGIFVIVLIVFVRFLRIQREREKASSELAAARSMQELMIPQESAHTPGFEVDSVYKPANEVGGDFFHIAPTPEGGMVVVLGDVAGKGLRAAMNVAMLVGGLRSEDLKRPTEILSMLNRVLHGSESMTTCLVAYFAPTGEVTMATAGHLPPYLNSQEVALPAGLPLGILSDVEYEEVRLYLHPGDRLLMLSDGVVEARKLDGELFGFDRVHNLSNQSAFFLADAAADFGQEDDITVLTVRRSGAGG